MADLNASVVGFGEGDLFGPAGSRSAGTGRSADREAALLSSTFASTGPAVAVPRETASPDELAHQLFVRLIDRDTKEPLSGLQVQAWDASGKNTELVAVASTNASGQCTLSITDAQLRDMFLEDASLLEIRIVSLRTHQVQTVWEWSLAQLQTRARIEVTTDEGEPGTTARFVVHGHVRDWTGLPIAEAQVVAFDVAAGELVNGVIQDVELGAVTTAFDGRYAITYDVGALSDTGIPIHLEVRAYELINGQQRGRLIIREEAPCRPAPTQRLELVVGGGLEGPSRYDRLTAAIALYPQSSNLTRMSERELDALACRAAVSRDELAILASARSAPNAVLQEAAFGVMSVEQIGDIEQLDWRHPSDLRRSVERAIGDGHLSSRFTSKVSYVVEMFREKTLGDVFSGTNPFGEALRLGLSDVQAKALVDAYLRLEVVDLGEFWRGARSLSVLREGEAFQRAQFIVAMSSLSLADISVVIDPCKPVAQQPFVPQAPPMRLPDRVHMPFLVEMWERRNWGILPDFSDIGRYQPTDWVELVDQVGAPPSMPGLNEVERQQSYATNLSAVAKQLYPMRSFVSSYVAQTALRAQRSTGRRLTSSAGLGTFFDTPVNASLDFAKQRVSTYLAKTTGALAAVSESDRPAVVAELEQLERLYKITKNADEIHALLAAGIDSAARAHAYDPEGLSVRTGLSLEAARRIHGYACAVASAAVALQVKYNGPSNRVEMGADLSSRGADRLKGRIVPDKATLRADLPDPIVDWRTLFAESDVCDCEHCHSVLSPAAYLVDLLRFLEGIRVGASDAKAALLSNGTGSFAPRRPDIAKIDLSCPNTDTPLPYVDLVNEILESVASALFAHEPELTYPAHIATTGEAIDLLATPELLQPPIHDNAYVNLAQQAYPWTLPFHFWLAEARAFLPQLGTPLYGIMQALSVDGPPGAANDKSYLPPPYAFDTAAAWERLSLWEEARDILLGQAGVAPAVNWGFPTSDHQWATKLLNADTFLSPISAQL